MAWTPSFGAWPTPDGVHFRVWAPRIMSLDAAIYDEHGTVGFHALQKDDEHCFAGTIRDLGPGTRYKYRLDGKDVFPDPAARFQPEGVHGPSEVVDASQYAWHSKEPTINAEQLVIYELHVGTFSPTGTFQGVREKLDYLKDLGITAVELMPVADFPGKRNWGYDGVALFAPARCYGHPDDLRRLIDAAHQRGLAVLLDVVYNHLGPDGNYTGVYSPYYQSKKHTSPWGPALNFDEKHSDMVRRFFLDNALYWLHDFRFDGLRLDATHAIVDDGPTHFLAELSTHVRQAFPQRMIHLIAEDSRNLAHMAQPINQSGYGLDGIWADDFHHQMRRLLHGDNEGYYANFTGTTEDLATTLEQGWFYTGQPYADWETPRGTDPSDLPPPAFVLCLQNHDQIGNRAFGERLHHQIELAAWRAASALLLCAPQTPLLFMGQEWAASTPFLFFTNHHAELGKLVTQGRRKEFKRFSAFRDPKIRDTIPDPQADATFEACRLNWQEQAATPHVGILRLYQHLLQLRQIEPALQNAARTAYDVWSPHDGVLCLLRHGKDSSAILLVSQFTAPGEVDLRNEKRLSLARAWQILLTTEDETFTAKGVAPVVDLQTLAVRFSGPATVLFKSTRTQV